MIHLVALQQVNTFEIVAHDVCMSEIYAWMCLLVCVCVRETFKCGPRIGYRLN